MQTFQKHSDIFSMLKFARLPSCAPITGSEFNTWERRIVLESSLMLHTKKGSPWRADVDDRQLKAFCLCNFVRSCALVVALAETNNNDNNNNSIYPGDTNNSNKL